MEYCEQGEATKREQYFMDFLKPTYNILPNAGSSFGYKPSEETIAKIKAKMKNRILTEDHKAKLLEQLKIYLSSAEHQEHLTNLQSNPEQLAKRLEQLKLYNSSAEHKEHLTNLHASKEHQEHLKRLNSIKSQKIEIFDTDKNETTVYLSISEAARAIGVSQGSLSATFKRKGVSTI